MGTSGGGGVKLRMRRQRLVTGLFSLPAFCAPPLSRHPLTESSSRRLFAQNGSIVCLFRRLHLNKVLRLEILARNR